MSNINLLKNNNEINIKNPLVSVIIPSYNCGKYISRAIDSALSQTYRNFEIIVVDDGSNDNTEEVIKKYIKYIKYIKQKNMGPSSARNNGIKNSKGEFIAFLDADDKWLENHLLTCIEALIKDSSLGLVFTHAINIFKDGKKEIRGLKNKETRVFPRIIWPIETQCTPNTVIRKNILQKTGLFDPAPRAYVDRELWIKIEEHLKIKEIEQIDVIVYKRKNSISALRNISIDISDYYKIINSALKRNRKLNIDEKKIIIANAYFISGRSYFSYKKFNKARKYFIKSSHYKLNKIVLLYLLSTYFSPMFIDLLKKVTRKFKKY